MNVFKQIKKQKELNKLNGNSNKILSKSTDKVVKTPTVLSNNIQKNMGLGINKKINISNIPNTNELARPIMKINNNNSNQIKLKNDTGITTITGVVKNQNTNQDEMFKFNVKKTSALDPTFDWDNQPVKGGSTSVETIEQRMQKDFFIDTINKNKLTQGTKIMMNNEVLHANEAIESGIYVIWTSKSVRKYY